MDCNFINLYKSFIFEFSFFKMVKISDIVFIAYIIKLQYFDIADKIYYQMVFRNYRLILFIKVL